MNFKPSFGVKDAESGNMIKLLKADLASALKSIIRVMDNKPAHPMMKFARLRLTKGFLYVDGGGQGNHAFTRVPATGDDVEGCVDPRLLLSILPSVHDHEVTLKPKGTKLVVQRESGNISLATVDAAAYPAPPTATQATDWITIPVAAIKGMIATLLCGTDEDRQAPALWHNIALLRPGSKTLAAVTSDGNRTAVAECVTLEDGETDLLVPIRALRGLLASLTTLPADVTEVQIGQDKNHIWIKAGDRLRLMYGKITTKFPDIFGRVLEKLLFTRGVEVRGQAIDEALKLMRAVGDETIRSFRLEVHPDMLVFYTEAKDRGSVKETVSVDCAKGFDPFITGYNADYLIPVFEQIAGPVAIEWSEMGSTHPLRVTHAGEHVRASWIVQSLNIYPGSKRVLAEVREEKNEN